MAMAANIKPKTANDIKIVKATDAATTKNTPDAKTLKSMKASLKTIGRF